MRREDGIGIIEIIIALAFIALVSLSLGRTLNALNRANMIAADKTIAQALAQESVELMLDLQNDFFACRSTQDIISGQTCTRSSDSQSCTLFAGYTSCWTAYPKDHNNQTRFYLSESGGTWQLNSLNTGQYETVVFNPRFSRVVEITNAYRDADGNLASSGTIDPQTKNVTVTVSWQERGVTHQSQASVILTAWQNL